MSRTTVKHTFEATVSFEKASPEETKPFPYKVADRQQAMGPQYFVFNDNGMYIGRIARCESTREWIARDWADRLWSGFGETRLEAVSALAKHHLGFGIWMSKEDE